ncbi:kallikrein-1-like [Erethizon dorsatum]
MNQDYGLAKIEEEKEQRNTRREQSEREEGGLDAVHPTLPGIIGGPKCQNESKAWQAALFRNRRFYCGGVLVHPQWVLTAAHCIRRKYQIWLGRHSLFDEEDTGQLVHVKKSFPHPQFNMSLLKPHHSYPDDDHSHDLMLVHLREPAQITDSVKVLELPTKEPEVGSRCFISGWNVFPYYLQCMDFKVLPKDQCEKALLDQVKDTMLCAGIFQSGRPNCVVLRAPHSSP